MNDETRVPDPDEILERLRTAAGDPILEPLAVSPPSPSLRTGFAGRLVTALRSRLLRLLSPALTELVGQLERDRHRVQREISALEARVAELEDTRPRHS